MLSLGDWDSRPPASFNGKLNTPLFTFFGVLGNILLILILSYNYMVTFSPTSPLLPRYGRAFNTGRLTNPNRACSHFPHPFPGFI